MDTNQIIKERYAQLPPDIQEAIKSTDLGDKFNKISETHGLRLDQNGALQTETLLVMVGLESADDYVDNIQKELEVSRDQAKDIADDVNTEILGSIRSSIRKIEEDEEKAEIQIAQGRSPFANVPIAQPSIGAPVPPPPPAADISSIEQAGNFTIEKPPVASTPLYKDTNLNRDEVLDDLENIEKLKPANSFSLVDHLLAGSQAAPSSSPTSPQIPTPEKPKIPEQKPAKPSVDPYREPF